MTELQAAELQATSPLDDELAPVPENAGADDTKHKKAVRVWQGVLVLILLGFVLLLAARLIQTNQSEQRASGVAPAFTLTTFDGQKISSADLLGKGVVLNFWASWCDPCRDEAAMLEETWNREKDNGIVIVGLDYLDQEPAAKAYMAEFGITYPSGPDLQSAAARRFGIKGVPETFFINPQGSITDIVIGPIVSQGKMDEYLAKIRPQ